MLVSIVNSFLIVEYYSVVWIFCSLFIYLLMNICVSSFSLLHLKLL